MIALENCHHHYYHFKLGFNVCNWLLTLKEILDFLSFYRVLKKGKELEEGY
jgi:hypothetical protein